MRVLVCVCVKFKFFLGNNAQEVRGQGLLVPGQSPGPEVISL